MSGPYTPKPMEAARADDDARDSRFEGLRAEASAAVGSGANTLRAVRERYREAYAEASERWMTLRDELETLDRAPHVAGRIGAADPRRRELRAEVELLGADLAAHQSTLAKLELAERTLSRTWLFLEHGDASLISGKDGTLTEHDVAMRIVEAQEAERTRLAQEIHDGPAQALTNAIFQADFIERVGSTDTKAAAEEVRGLRDLLRRELGNVRDFIYQLRPAQLGDAGLDEVIEEAVERVRGLTDLTITTDLRAPDAGLDDRARTVVLRVTQEALQNIRKHAGASTVTVRTALVEGHWTLEIHDDGHGFDVGAATARGRRNFGLPFMRERAELIGGHLDIRSTPGETEVRLTIPRSARSGAEEST